MYLFNAFLDPLSTAFRLLDELRNKRDAKALQKVLFLDLKDTYLGNCDDAVFIRLVGPHDNHVFSDPLHWTLDSKRECVGCASVKHTFELVPSGLRLDDYLTCDIDVDLFRADV